LGASLGVLLFAPTDMHNLIPLGLPLPGTLTTAEIDTTLLFAAAEKATATREACAADWRDFTAWCAPRGAMLLPAHVGIVGAYLSNLAVTKAALAIHSVEANHAAYTAAIVRAKGFGTTDPVPNAFNPSFSFNKTVKTVSALNIVSGKLQP